MEIGTITRRLDKVMDELTTEFQLLYNPEVPLINRQDLLNILKELRALGNSSRVPSVEAKLFKTLDAFGIDYERGRSVDYYEKIVGAMNLPDSRDFESRMILAMYKRYDKFPSPQEYIQRLVDKFSFAQDNWRGDSLRLRILKQFIKYGNFLKDAGFGGQQEIRNYVRNVSAGKLTAEDICRILDDGIFDKLVSANKPQKKPEGKFGLLKLADDLASGKFRTGGATKRGLYMFAMVFNMGIGDVEQKLFRDYYSNNMMRFLTEAYRSGISDYEMTPSGQGINYKNFAEMIYLYFISSNLSPSDKVALSSRMIEEVQLEFTASTQSDFDTRFYRINYDKIFELNPAQFKKFILDNYDCSAVAKDTKTGKTYSIGFMKTQTAQNTAVSVQSELLQKLSRLIDATECNYGLWFADVRSLENNFAADSSKFSDFKILMECIDKLLKDWQSGASKNVSRTSLMTIYYYYYNELHNSDAPDSWRNFEDHFHSFKGGLNKWLEKAFYQPFDARNIFDVAVIFSSYAYLNL